MTGNSWVIFCWAYIVGLAATNLVIWGSDGLTKQQLMLIVLALISLAVILSLTIYKLRLGKITYRLWIGATIIGILGVIYFNWRIPQPHTNDISYQVTSSEDKLVTVVGKVLNEPRLNENQRLKFWLATAAIKPSEEVSGKLYVTVPLLQGTGIYAGQNLEIKGILYLPQAASNPGGFNFKSYLARQGIFAGLKGMEVTFTPDSQPSWGWWRLRQRIVRSQLRGLGSPVGQLVSSMVLGQKAVDLPKDIRDRFIEVGLAHVLAASGFQVSLLIGLVLKLTTSLSKQVRLVTGVGTLVIYLSLTGIGASILRAFLMGIAVLIALVMDTKVKPLGSLLFAATIILLLNPLLIGDLGFQLSFLATLGLIVTLPALQAKLDWLPPTIAALIAVPVAASIWVLPLLGYVFNTVASYSLLVNILVTPLITIISLGGMLSAIAALVMPILGSAIAFMLLYPTLLLLAITNFFTSLPGSSWAIGQISLGVLLIIYGLIILLHLNLWWQKHWRIALVFILTLLVIPIGYNHWRLTQITVLASNSDPVIVIQDQGQVLLINGGEDKSIRYSVLPFLMQQGINHLDYAINLNSDLNFESNWLTISEHLPINYFVSLGDQSHLLLNNSRIKSKSFNEPINTKSFNLSFNSKLSVLQLETTEARWLILNDFKRDDLEIAQYIQQSNWNKKPLILLGSKISATWLQLLPKTIITSKPLPANLKHNLDTVTSYNLQQHGAIAWTPKYNFQTSTSIIESTSNNNY